ARRPRERGRPVLNIRVGDKAYPGSHSGSKIERLPSLQLSSGAAARQHDLSLIDLDLPNAQGHRSWISWSPAQYCKGPLQPRPTHDDERRLDRIGPAVDQHLAVK